MGSKLFESYVLSIQTGLGVPHISGKQIQSFTFNKPSLEEQGVIADKLKILSTEIDKLKSIYAKKVESLNELKQSILQKAFSGRVITLDQEKDNHDLTKKRSRYSCRFD